jgi:SP family general alpha glucoside:H+ symporter-like MFS transporter
MSSPHIEQVETQEKPAYDHVELGNEKAVTWDQVRAEADRDEQWQHSLSIWQSLKIYKAAAGWSILGSFCIIMEAYDTLLLGSLFALPAFKEHVSGVVD